MKETYYFSHDYNARTDPKLVKVLMTLKQEGLGVYWCLAEMLYEEGGYLELNECNSYAFALHTDIKVIDSLINDFDLFKKDEKHFWSETILARLKKRKNKSLLAKKSAKARWDKVKKGNADAMRSQSDSNAIKESKVKEIKVKENKNPLHTQMIEIYFIWYEKKFNRKPQFDGGDAKGIKDVIKYFSENDKKKEGDGYIKESFNLILSLYDKWKPFYKENTRMKQIASNISNIINYLENEQQGKISQEFIQGLANDLQDG